MNARKHSKMRLIPIQWLVSQAAKKSVGNNVLCGFTYSLDAVASLMSFKRLT